MTKQKRRDLIHLIKVNGLWFMITTVLATLLGMPISYSLPMCFFSFLAAGCIVWWIRPLFIHGERK
jgi:hypothetical protein